MPLPYAAAAAAIAMLPRRCYADIFRYTPSAETEQSIRRLH